MSWLRGSHILVRAQRPAVYSEETMLVWANNVPGHARYAPYGQWARLDVTRFVPPETVAVQLHTQMAITESAPPLAIDLEVCYRSPADPMDSHDFIDVQCEAYGPSAMRQGDTTWVPVFAGAIEWYWWNRYPVPPVPTGPVCGVHAEIVAVLLP